MFTFNDLKDIIYKQINNKNNKNPEQEDVKHGSSIIITSVDNKWKIVNQYKNCENRTNMILKILDHMNVHKNKEILLFLDDYTKNIKNINIKSLCFAKKYDQSFITIPNIHWLVGFVNKVFIEVDKYDTPFINKNDATIFAGGPNCEYGEVRCRYIFSNLDRKKHHIFLCNNDNHRMKIEQQLKYKYLINIDGYGLCYDRLYWQMYSNSVPIYIERNLDIFQIPDCFIKENINYISSTVDKIDETFDYLNNTKEGQQHCLEIINNNKYFIHEFFTHHPQARAFEILRFILDNM